MITDGGRRERFESLIEAAPLAAEAARQLASWNYGRMTRYSERAQRGQEGPSRDPGDLLIPPGPCRRMFMQPVMASTGGQSAALRCVSVPGMGPGKLTVESQRSTPVPRRASRSEEHTSEL